MNVQAEVSLYPLRTHDLGHAIGRFLGALKAAGLTERPHRLPGEGPMDAPAGERFVVDHVTELFPGLWTTGMSVCASQGGPRMGPIFGGMLLSGVRVAERLAEALSQTDDTGD